MGPLGPTACTASVLVGAGLVFFLSGGMYTYLRPQLAFRTADELLFVYPASRHQLMLEPLIVAALVGIAVFAATYLAVLFPHDDRRHFTRAALRFGAPYRAYWRDPWRWLDSARPGEPPVTWPEDEDIAARVLHPVIAAVGLVLALGLWAAFVSYKSSYPFNILTPWTLLDWSSFSRM